MLPSWMRSRNCRPRLVYFLAIEMTRRRLASTISFLAMRASRSPFCTMATMRRYSGICRPVAVASSKISSRMTLIESFSSLTNFFQPNLARRPTRFSQSGSSSLRLVFLEELGARHLVGLGQAHEAAFQRVEALVDVVELLDQRLDAGVVERQRLHLGDDLLAQLLVAALLRGRELGALGHFLVLQLAQRLVVPGDVVEDLEHLGLQLRFHGGERHAEVITLVVVLLLDLRLVEILRAQHVAELVVADGRADGGRTAGSRRAWPRPSSSLLPWAEHKARASAPGPASSHRGRHRWPRGR